MVEPAAVASEPTPVEAPFELMVERRPEGLVRRSLTTNRHFLGLLGGGLVALVRDAPKAQRKGFKFRLAQLFAAFFRPWIRKDLRVLPFPVQLRRRLEILGPTYIKLGQVLSLREDMLPRAVTEELKNLFDRLPVVPFERWLGIVEETLGRPAMSVFREVDRNPLGSASIAQIHRAVTHDGEDVVLKVVKPGIRETLTRDATLLKILGFFLQWIFPRLQPKRMIAEFVDYTLREVDLRREGDNAETFAANFKDQPDIVFPKIYRAFSGENVLCMELFRGHKPSAPEVQSLPEEDRDRLVDLGSAAIIRMLYKDGFFHADLHPGNLMVLPGPKAGFIDLGMVGRFNDELRRALLYYFFSLVTGDAESAARYLAAVAQPMPGADVMGFRREVEEVCRRWQRAANFQEFSLAQLIMASVAQGVHFRMYFPVETVLMVKAIVTFEGVGQILKPGFDVAATSKTHINKIFLQQFSPLRFAKEGLKNAPDLIDALIKAPSLVTEGLRLLESATRQPSPSPFHGIRGTIFGGFCIVAGAILAAAGAAWYWAVALFAFGLIVAFSKGR